MPDPDTASPSGAPTPPEHELTPMESFFDNLFNHHMVLPQPPEDLRPSEGDADHDPPHDHRAADPDPLTNPLPDPL